MKRIYFAAITLAAVGSLQAGTVTNTASTSMGTEQDVTISLAKFDTSLGTLTGIYIEYVTHISGAYVQIDNDASFSQNARAIAQSSVNSFSSAVRLDGTNIETDDSRLNLYKSKLFTLGATSGDTVGSFNATGLSDYTNWNSGTVSATISGYVDSGVFADYIGSGSFDSYINSTILSTASVGSDTYYMGNSPSGVFSAKVIYEYTPIPEPATASMMVLAGLLALLARRHLTA
jgi:hypothetical protein